MKDAYREKMIRRIRNSGMLFAESDIVAERSSALLQRLLSGRKPREEKVDHLGWTRSDREMLSGHGLAVADYM